MPGPLSWQGHTNYKQENICNFSLKSFVYLKSFVNFAKNYNICVVSNCQCFNTSLSESSIFVCLFVCVDVFHQSQQFFSHVGTISCLPELNQ